MIKKTAKNVFDNGIDEVMVMVGRKNDIAAHICEKLGFEKTDTCLTYSKQI